MVTFETWRDWCIEAARKGGVCIEKIGGKGFVSFRNLTQDYKTEVFIPERYLDNCTTREIKSYLKTGTVSCYTGLSQ
jgi:hypothetical protein